MARITTVRIRWSSGFTLVELMIVVAIIGILAAIAIPNFIRYQLRSKTTEAKVVLGGIKTSEESFRAEIDGYGSAQELSAKGLLDPLSASALGVDRLTPPELITPAGGRAFGYSFTIELSPDRQHFVASAIPAAPGRSGDRSFFIDETGVLTFTCPPGTKYDPITDLCVPSDNYLLIQAIAAIQKIDTLSDGKALPLARRLVQSSGVVAKMLAALDTNGDKALTVDEALGENRLVAGRVVQPDFGSPLRPGPPFLALEELLRDYTRNARNDLAPGIAGAPPVNVPLSDMNGDVAAFLALVSPLH